MTVKIIPAYLIHWSTRLRLSISLKTRFDIPAVLRTSNAFLCALCTKISTKYDRCVSNNTKSNTSRSWVLTLMLILIIIKFRTEKNKTKTTSYFSISKQKHVKMPKPTKLMKNITSKSWAGAGCVKKTSCMFHEGSADLRFIWLLVYFNGRLMNTSTKNILSWKKRKTNSRS